jgi:hypothetical protein
MAPRGVSRAPAVVALFAISSMMTAMHGNSALNLRYGGAPPEAVALSDPRINGTRKLRAGAVENVAPESFATGIGVARSLTPPHPVPHPPLQSGRMTFSVDTTTCSRPSPAPGAPVSKPADVRCYLRQSLQTAGPGP